MPERVSFVLERTTTHDNERKHHTALPHCLPVLHSEPKRRFLRRIKPGLQADRLLHGCISGLWEISYRDSIQRPETEDHQENLCRWGPVGWRNLPVWRWDQAHSEQGEYEGISREALGSDESEGAVSEFLFFYLVRTHSRVSSRKR